MKAESERRSVSETRTSCRKSDVCSCDSLFLCQKLEALKNS